MRSYSKISTSLWRSRKFRALKNNGTARLLYLYLHSCRHGNLIGCFHLPLGYIQTDLNIGKRACEKAIESLCEVGLIEWDDDEELIRIVDFVKQDAPTNGNHATALAKAALDLPDCEAKAAVAKDLLAEAHKPEPSLLDELESLCEVSEDPSEALSDSLPKGSEEPSESLSKGSSNPIPKPTPIPESSPSEMFTPNAAPAAPDEIGEMVGRYNAAADRAGLAKVQKLTNSRKRRARQRLKDCGGLDGWSVALEKMEASSFLTGGGRDGWKANFDFLMQESSITKLMEGAYDDRGPGPGPNSPRPAHGSREDTQRRRAGIAQGFADLMAAERASPGQPGSPGSGNA